jgi:hypothetical protein
VIKIIETLDEVARATPEEDRPMAKEARALKRIEEERLRQLNEPTIPATISNYSKYAGILEELQDEICKQDGWRENLEMFEKYEALQTSIDALDWVFHVTYHLDLLNKLRDKLDKETTDERP